MQESTFTLERPDGARIHVNRWLPDGDVKATVLIAHGLAEYGARYAPMAEAFTAAGYAVWAPDHRGHGQSVADPEDRGHMADTGGWLLVLEDLKALLDRIADEHPDVPHFFLGHSMGSFLGQTFLFRYPGGVDGAILQCTDSGAFPLHSIVRAVVGTDIGLRGLHATSKLNGLMDFVFNLKTDKRTPKDWIAKDESHVDAYIADPMTGFPVTNALYRDIEFGMKLNADATNVDRIPKNLPVYLPHGELCPVGDYGRGVRRLEKQYTKAGMTNVEVKSYPGVRHEIHFDESKEQVLADHVAWLDRQVDVIESRKSAA